MIYFFLYFFFLNFGSPWLYFLIFNYGNVQRYTNVKKVIQWSPITHETVSTITNILLFLFCLSLSLQHFFPLENFKTNTRHGISAVNCWMNICRALIPHHHLTSLMTLHQGPWTIQQPGLFVKRQSGQGRGKSDLGLNPKPCRCVSVDSLTIQLSFCKREIAIGTSLTC